MRRSRVSLLKFSSKFPACQGRVHGGWDIQSGVKIAVDLFSVRRTDNVETVACMKKER